MVTKETIWSNRMDHYLKFGNENIHLAAILLSLGIIATLVVILAGIMKRGLNQDFINIAKNKLSMNKRRQERAQVPRDDDPEQRGL